MNFYTATIMVAIILLIIALAFIGVTMNTATKQRTFPSSQNLCPDGWNPSGSSCTYGTTPANLNTGLGARSNNVQNILNQPDICTAKRWSVKNNVQWDGVSNYNGECK